jgi:hypothetical protein
MSNYSAADNESHSDGKIYTNIHANNKKKFKFLSKTRYLDQIDFSEKAEQSFPYEKAMESRVFLASTEIYHQSLGLISHKNFNSLCTQYF